MLVSQHRKTLNLKNCQVSEMLLNRESNPGLPRLVVSNHMTTEMVVSGIVLSGKRILGVMLTRKS
jgi:hypothetical protein